MRGNEDDGFDDRAGGNLTTARRERGEKEKNGMERIEAVRDRLASVGQEHLLKFASELEAEEVVALISQIESIDLENLPTLIEEQVRRSSTFEMPSGIRPPDYYPRDPEDPKRPYDAAKFRKVGEDLIRRGKVAVFCVAGGQGTRLGWDGPKGAFPATPITKKPLFRLFAEQLLAAKVKYNRSIPFYVMTSPMNHGDTVAFFNEHHYFGLNPADVRFFTQGLMPAFEKETGRVLLADQGHIAFSPDGHGGSLLALHRSGALENMRERGIEVISYIQVDNPLVKAVDPLFIGLHHAAEDSSGEMSSKMLPKIDPREKLGNLVRTEDGRTMVIEYSDLPEELAEERDESGELRFRAGSIAIHCISVDFVDRLNNPKSGIALPWHRAEKKVPHIDLTTGIPVEPREPNAVKLEKFVFDALPLCESSIILETDRVEEFAPIKNLSGVDSAESSREIQIARHAKWLESLGVDVPRDESGRVNAVLEISPLTACEPGDLLACDLPERIQPGAELHI